MVILRLAKFGKFEVIFRQLTVRVTSTPTLRITSLDTQAKTINCNHFIYNDALSLHLLGLTWNVIFGMFQYAFENFVAKMDAKCQNASIGC